VALLGCGQKGPLLRPTDEAAQGRATLIESLTPDVLRQHKTAPSISPTSPTPPSLPKPALPADLLSPEPVAR